MIITSFKLVNLVTVKATFQNTGAFIIFAAKNLYAKLVIRFSTVKLTIIFARSKLPATTFAGMIVSFTLDISFFQGKAIEFFWVENINNIIFVKIAIVENIVFDGVSIFATDSTTHDSPII